MKNKNKALEILSTNLEGKVFVVFLTHNAAAM